ncbi:MAG: phosphate ABC transporter substrate-binding protein PstS [Candidatus Sulfotelmatobacter sp.]
MLVLALVQIATAQDSGKVRLIGVGATSPVALYSKWFQAFERTRPDLNFIYIPSGSEAGMEMVASGTADFGATDAPMTDKRRAKGKVLQIATALGAVVPIYNLPREVGTLNFSAKALAGIYLGTITKWNDPAISGPNPGVELPPDTIAVIHGAEGRGTTYIWSDYLSKVSLEWRTKIGRGISIEWPTGKEADGNGNLARMVKQTPNSIGYVQFIYAVQNRVPYGQVQNAAGNFISADSSTITAAATASAKAAPSGFRASITNPLGDKSYPIASFTWILVLENMESATKREALKDFLRWALDEGQTYAERAGFARLPKAIAEEELNTIENIP